MRDVDIFTIFAWAHQQIIYGHPQVQTIPSENSVRISFTMRTEFSEDGICQPLQLAEGCLEELHPPRLLLLGTPDDKLEPGPGAG